MMVRTKIFVKEDTKMLYTEKEKHEIERVKEVFAEHLWQSPDFELLWSDKVGYVWLAIGVNPLARSGKSSALVCSSSQSAKAS